MQDFDRIETPENVELEQPLAGIGSRCLAGITDHLILVLIFLGLAIVLFIFSLAPGLSVLERGFQNTSWWVMAAFILAAFVIYWGYFGFCEWAFRGQTPGKKSAHIRVVREGGTPLTFTDIAVRNLLRVVDGFGIYGVAGVVMFFSRKVQRLGDMAAGTVVILEEVPDYAASRSEKAGQPWQMEATATALRATRLTPEEYRLLTNYWMRRHNFTIEARARILPALLQPIVQRLGGGPAGSSLQDLERYANELIGQALAAEGGAQRADGGDKT